MKPVFTNMIASLFLMIFMGLEIGVFAASSGKYYQVQRGDSLYRISQRFGVPLADLARANRLQVGSQIATGSRLWIPESKNQSTNTRSRSTSSASSPSKSYTFVRKNGRRVIVTRPTSEPSSASPSSSARSYPRLGGSSSSTSSRSSNTSGVYTVGKGDTLWGLAQRYGFSVGELARYNGISASAGLEVGQKIRIPSSSVASVEDVPGGGIKVNRPSRRQVTNPSSSSSRGKDFIWPVEGEVLRSFTKNSEESYVGLDIGVPYGTEVRAARSGTVVYSDDSIPYYNAMIIISHDDGFATCYAQNSRLLVREGQRVQQGQVIARSGNSGMGGNPYLHFELRKNSEAVNPEPYLP